jgi:hypothetical protein
MSNDQSSTASPADEPNEAAGTARDVLSAFNAEGVVDDPGRPTPNDPQESLPSEADLPQPQ